MPKIARKFTLKGFRLAGWGLLALLFLLTLMAAPLVEGAFLSQSESLTASKGLEQTAATADPGEITFSKSFLPNTIGPGSVSTLQFVINNISPIDTVTDLAFTDILPADVTIATPANIVVTCPDSLVLAPDGGGTISFSGERLGAGNSCVIKVDVTSSTPGTHTNTSGDLTSNAGNSGTATADLTVATDRPGFSKSFSPSSVDYGGRSTVTFTIDNTANASSEIELTFSDNLPLGMVIADPPNASTTCGTPVLPPVLTAVPGTAEINFSAIGVSAFPAIAAGAFCTVTVDVMGNAVGQLDNATEELLIFVDFFTTKSSGKASASLEVTIDRISLVKSFTDDPVPPGGTTTLEFTILNLDRVNSLTNIAFTDDLDATLSGLAAIGLPLADPCGTGSQLTGTSLLTLSGGILPAEGSCTFSVTLQTLAGSVPGEYPNTTSSITADIDTHSVTGNPATETLFIQPVPVLTKEFVDDPVGTGGTVTMRFTVTNSSLTSVATDIAFMDELTTFFPFPLSVTLPATPCGGGSSISLINMGIDGQGLSLIGGSLAAGASCTFDVGLDIPLGVPTGTYTNTSEEITAEVDGTTYAGSPSSDELIVVAAPSLSMAFTDDPVAPGGTVTLEFTITNSDETHRATGISFTDDLSAVLAGLTANLPPTPDPPCGAGSTLTGSAGDTLLTLMGGSLESGASCTFSVTLDVLAGAAYGKYANATSTISAVVNGITAISNSAQDDLTVSGLNFTKEFIGDPVIPGDTVTLRFTIENISPTDDATITFFTDNLGSVLSGLAATGPPTVNSCGGTLSGTTSLIYVGGSVLSGQTCTIEVTLQVPVGAASDTYLNTTSSLVAAMGSSTVILDPATDSLVVDYNLIALTKEFTDDPVVPGKSVTLEFTLTNLHTAQSATTIAFSDDLGAALAGLTFDSVLFDDCGGSVSGIGTDLVTVSGVSLTGGGSCTIRVSLTVPAGVVAGTYTNTTSGVTGTIDGFPVTGDAVSDDLHVVKMTFTKSFDGPTTATGMATLTFTITNPNSSVVRDIVFTDDLDAVLLGLVATNLPLNDVCGVGSQLTGTSFVTLTGAELRPMGGICSFDIDLQVPVTATAGTFPNTTSDLFSAGLKMSDPATADLTIEPPPTFAKSFAPDLIIEGNISTLSFTIDNTASALAATNLDFTDNLPAGMTVANLPNASTTCTGGTLTAVAGTGGISFSGGVVGAGAACTIQVDVTGNTAGQHVNTTGDLTSSSGNSGTASDTLSVNPKAVLAINDITMDEAASSATFTVTLSAASIADVTVDYITGDDTAVQPNDYLAASGTLTIRTGSTTANVMVTLVDDLLDENNETFKIMLSNPVNATIGDDEGVGTITDDDAEPTLTINDVTTIEAAGSIMFTVTQSAVSGLDVSVDFATADGTAVQPDDYTATSGTAVILAGTTAMTITVPINDDALTENSETFTMTLSSPVNATITDGEGVGTIISTDAVVFLPLVLNDVTYAPDLVITSLSVSSSNAQVVIENQGSTAVVDEFWVDVYIDPSTPPTMVNQTWPQLAEEGLVWGVTGSALPLAPGDSLVLTLNDAYYLVAFSEFSGTILPETAVYAQVDSADANTTFGAVLETHEMNGDPYNNIFRTTATTTGLPSINWLAFKVDFRAQYDLPERS